jgi:hypothetical protein
MPSCPIPTNDHHQRCMCFTERGVQLTRLPRWSAGSVLFLASWAFLMGPYQYAVHLVSGSRLPFTAAYFGSIVMTIYFAVGVCCYAALFETFLLITLCLASIHPSHFVLVYRPTRCTIMVSGQLFPHGKHRSSFCSEDWRRAGSSLVSRFRRVHGVCRRDKTCLRSGIARQN